MAISDAENLRGASGEHGVQDEGTENATGPIAEVVSLPLEERVAAIESRIQSEPKLVRALYRMLALCRSPRAVDEVLGAWSGWPEAAGSVFEAPVVLSWLTDVGALSAAAAVAEGEGSTDSHEALSDADYSKSAPCVVLTEAGAAALEAFERDRPLETLLAEQARYQSVFADILAFCIEPRTKKAIEDFLRDNPLLLNPRLFPGFFIDRLERARALSWNGGWLTTDEGRAWLAQERG